MEVILSFIQNFLKKTWAFLGFAENNFWVFLSVPHLVDNYAKIVDGRGRNLMCHCTLPSRLVLIKKHLFFFLFQSQSGLWESMAATLRQSAAYVYSGQTNLMLDKVEFLF